MYGGGLALPALAWRVYFGRRRVSWDVMACMVSAHVGVVEEVAAFELAKSLFGGIKAVSG